MKKEKQDNRGFTLIELLLSIVLLAILILPALYGFFTSAKINKKANDTQVATDMAQNILETVKNLTIEDAALQFYGKNFSILNNNYIVNSYVDEGYGEYIYASPDHTFTRVTADNPLASVRKISEDPTSDYSFNPPAGSETFYFGMKDVKVGGSTYDAVITMDASNYSNTTKYIDTMNNYEMPRLIDLNQDAVSVIDLEGMTTTWSDDSETAYITKQDSKDEQAINDFNNMNLSYIAELKSRPVPEGTTPTYPDPVGKASIIANTKKTIVVKLEKNTDQKKVLVTCLLSYTCGLDLNGDGNTNSETLSMEFVSGTFPILEKEKVESNVYLFYTPSVFTDSINIMNNGAKANVFIVNQNKVPKEAVAINKLDTLESTTNIFTNLGVGERKSLSVINDKLYELEDAKNRIYNVTVSIYRAGTIASGSLGKELVTLTSTGEE